MHNNSDHYAPSVTLFKRRKSKLHTHTHTLSQHIYMLHRQQKRKTKDYTDDRDKLIEDDDG
jgi:hypothetical protein